MKARKAKHGWLLTLIFSVISVLYMYPIILVFINSFKKKAYISRYPFKIPKGNMFVGWENYIRGLEKTGFFEAFLWTLFITVCSVALIVVCCSMCAWYISRVKTLSTKIIIYLGFGAGLSLEVDTMAISAFETLLINNIVEAMTKALEQAIIDGNGTGKPKGILAETPADGQTIESAAPSYSDLIKAEGALPMAYENGAVWCMSKMTFMEYVGMTDKNGQPIAKVNYGTSGKPERTLLGRTVVLCDYVASYSAALTKDTIFAFLFNFKDYVLNTNYSMGVKKYEDNDTDDQITKGIMLVDGKVVDKNSLVVVKKIEAV